MTMKTYLVGGAVRDELLGLHIKDRDWVVVGETIHGMLDKGFKQVGIDFPVFLHPDTHEEYALARGEKIEVTADKGVRFDFSPSVTLEEDLRRRDLTINAMALDAETNEIIDPYNGQQDLENQILRHISESFADDPARILRIARLKARYKPLGFTIAPETMLLMKQLVEEGALSTITADRIWPETVKALMELNASEYFKTLRKCGALAVLFPELETLYGVPQPASHHPEICTGTHVMMALDMACKLTANPMTRFAVLCHDFGKGVTPKEMWPKHHNHEIMGIDQIKALSRRMKVPNTYRDLAVLTSKCHTMAHASLENPAKTTLSLFNRTDAIRRPDRFKLFLVACEADARGRKGFENASYPQAEFLNLALEHISRVSAKPLVEKGMSHNAFIQALHLAKLKAIKEARQEFESRQAISTEATLKS